MKRTMRVIFSIIEFILGSIGGAVVVSIIFGHEIKINHKCKCDYDAEVFIPYDTIGLM